MYKDIYTAILKHCDFNTSIKLGLVCKVANNAYKEFTKDLYKEGKYTLKPTQAYTRDKFLRGYDVVLQAPYSYGKTAIGLSVAFHNWSLSLPNALTIIIVPSKALQVWKNEAIKMYGNQVYNSSDENSPLLIPHSQENSLHLSVMKNNKLTKKNVAILLSNSVCKKYTYLLNLFRKINIIIDEAHANNEWKLFIKDNHHYLFLSASEYKIQTTSKTKLKRIIIRDEIMNGKIPSVEYSVSQIKDIFEYIPSQNEEKVDLDMKPYCIKIYNLCKNLGEGNDVIFCPGGSCYDKVKSYLYKVCSVLNKDYYEYDPKKKSKFDTLIDFEKSSNSILLIAHSQSESISINASRAFIIRGDWVNQERINQMIGRLTRTTNKNKNIKIFHVVPGGLPKLKLIYSDACNKVGIHNGVSSLNSPALYNAFKIINMVVKVEDAKPIDIVVLCNQNCNKNKELYDLWLSNKFESSFTKEQKMKIIDDSYF